MAQYTRAQVIIALSLDSGSITRAVRRWKRDYEIEGKKKRLGKDQRITTVYSQKEYDIIIARDSVRNKKGGAHFKSKIIAVNEINDQGKAVSSSIGELSENRKHGLYLRISPYWSLNSFQGVTA